MDDKTTKFNNTSGLQDVVSLEIGFLVNGTADIPAAKQLSSAQRLSVQGIETPCVSNKYRFGILVLTASPAETLLEDDSIH